MLTLAGGASSKPAESVELVVKRYADAAKGNRAFQTMELLWRAGFDADSPFNIPRPVRWLPDANLLVQEMARGVLLPEHLGRDDGVAPMEFAARWLAELHRLGPLAPDVPTYDADARSITTFVAQLAGRYQSLAAHLGEVAGAILEKVETCDASSFTMVHGDFHPENIFVRPNGATVIDFDVFCRSDPARDLGHFIAQTRAMAYFSTGSLDASNAALRTFLDAYHRALPPRDAESLACRIPAFTARAFLESLYYILAVLRSDRPDVLSVWLREIEHLVRAERAEELLGAPV
jgi:Ser/Thr protein kinase RdoA (MazF antagonist)